jgi:hypothetical protein
LVVFDLLRVAFLTAHSRFPVALYAVVARKRYFDDRHVCHCHDLGPFAAFRNGFGLLLAAWH